MSDSTPLSCEYFSSNRCRSCTLLPLGEMAAGAKFTRLEGELRSEFGERFALSPIETPETIFPSRSRVKLTVSGTADAPVIGLLDNTLTGIELLNCPLHFPRLNALLHFFKKLIAEHGLHPYDAAKRSGELKGLILLSNSERSEIILRVVLRSTSLQKRLTRLVPVIQTAFPEVKVISMNLQPIPHAIVEGPEEILLTETRTITESYRGRRLVLAPQSFTQVTPEIAGSLYLKATDWAGEHRNFLDLFCGVGGFSLFLSEKISSGTGVEISEQAILCAKKAAEIHARGELQFFAGDVSEFIARQDAESFDLILVNPPRRGLSEKIIAELHRLRPRQLLYSSCNSETLIRDLRLLTPAFQLERVAPFDMFPLTEHLEVLTSLQGSR